MAQNLPSAQNSFAFSIALTERRGAAEKKYHCWKRFIKTSRFHQSESRYKGRSQRGKAVNIGRRMTPMSDVAKSEAESKKIAAKIEALCSDAHRRRCQDPSDFKKRHMASMPVGVLIGFREMVT